MSNDTELKWSNAALKFNNTHLTDVHRNEFKALLSSKEKPFSISPTFNAVSIYDDSLATAMATQHYLEEINQLSSENRDPAIHKLCSLLMTHPNYYGDLSAQQQLTLYDLMCHVTEPVHISILVHFFKAIQAYPEFTITTLEKELAFMDTFSTQGHNDNLREIWHTPHVTHMANFIGKISAIKGALWGINSPHFSYRYLTTEAGYHDNGHICLDISPKAEIFDPMKAMGLISHELDHYIHWTMKHKKERLAPKTENMDDAYAYIEILSKIYVSHKDNHDLYRNSPTEKIAFNTTKLWHKFMENEDSQQSVRQSMVDEINYQKTQIKLRQELWGGLR